ncbi:variable surface protein [Plasmodium gonderi]|uniref:Variable surface protein n=1 Tax=Plasmodium gonderi TaxID=77519 RepID=A0A1Y1JVY6_PLAGO|nr:variable surface protein [Plasmodium gonderi]GAW84044.1 variable surface protein [Plasmodium gonderi]
MSEDYILNLIKKNENCSENNEECKLQLFKDLDDEVAQISCESYGCSIREVIKESVINLELKKFYTFFFNNFFDIEKYSENACACLGAWIQKKKNDYIKSDTIMTEMASWENNMEKLFNFIKETNSNERNKFCEWNSTVSQCILSTKTQSVSFDTQARYTKTFTSIPKIPPNSFKSSIKNVFFVCFILLIILLLTFIFLINLGKIQKFLYNTWNVKFLISNYRKNSHQFENYDDFPFVSENERYNMHYMLENNS